MLKRNAFKSSLSWSDLSKSNIIRYYKNHRSCHLCVWFLICHTLLVWVVMSISDVSAAQSIALPFWLVWAWHRQSPIIFVRSTCVFGTFGILVFSLQTRKSNAVSTSPIKCLFNSNHHRSALWRGASSKSFTMRSLSLLPELSPDQSSNLLRKTLDSYQCVNVHFIHVIIL